MNHKAACQVIEKLEKKFSQSVYIGDQNVWPLIRLQLWSQLTSSLPSKNSAFIFIFLKELLRDFFFLIKFFFLKKKRKYKKIKNIFFCSKKSITKIYNSNFEYDRNIDPIYSDTDKYSVKFYYDSLFKINNLAYDEICFYPSTKFLRILFEILNFNFKNVKKIAEYLERYNISKKLFIKNFKNELLIFLIWKYRSKSIFENLKDVKNVYVFPWYSSRMMGVISSSYDYKINTYDIQHGVQGASHAMYTHWNLKERNRLIPNYFICWDKITKNLHTISSNMIFNNNHQSIIIKKNWTNFYKKNFLFKKKLIKKKTLLFCIQPRTSTNNEILPSFLINFIKDPISDEFNFLIRSHPNDKNSIKIVKSILKGFDKNVLYDNSDYSIESAFEKCSHCLTAFSSTTVQSSLYNLKSAFFGIDAKKILKMYIKKGNVEYLKPNRKSLYSWLKSK